MKRTNFEAFLWALCFAAAIVGAYSPAAFADFAPILAGPEFQSSTQTGYINPLTNSPPTLLVNNNGTSVGTVDKFSNGSDLGYYGLRWGGSGSTTTELGSLAGQAYAVAVNNNGMAAGWSEINAPGAAGQRAVRWDASTTSATELGNLGVSVFSESNGAAYAINDSGTAVGYSEKYVAGNDFGERTVRWDGSGVAATELGNLGTSSNATFSRAFAVNSSGTAVGYAEKYVSGQDRGQRAVRWAGSGTAATELTSTLGTTSNGSTTSEAVAVNDAGTAVGWAKKYVADADHGYRAVRWDPSSSTSTELGNLGTSSGGSTNSFAYAVNGSGTAVGSAEKYVNGAWYNSHAVRWDASGTVATELGQLGIDGYGSTALAVNDSGTAVGWTVTGPSINSRRAVAWKSDGVAIDLNTLIDPASGWTLTKALGISNTGWVSGIGVFDPDGPDGESGYQRLFVLHLVPEPTAPLLTLPVVLFGLGMRFRCSRFDDCDHLVARF